MNFSEGQLRVMIDAIPALAWTCLPDGSTEFLNKRWLEYTGLSMEESLGSGWKVPVHQQDLGKLLDTWGRLLETGEPGEEEARLRRFDGEYRWFLFRAVPMRDERGNVVRWYGTNTDIDDLKRVEEKLHQAEHELRLMIDTIPTMAFTALPDGSIDFVSQSWLDYTGFSMEDWMGWGWMTVVHPEDRDKTAEKWQATLVSGKPYECEVRTRTANGSYRWCLSRAVPMRNAQGKVARWYGTNTDIDDRKRAEEKLHQADKELRVIVDTIPTMVWSALPDGSVDFLSRSWLEYYGLSLEDAKAWGWRDLVHPEHLEGIVNKWRASVTSGEPYEHEVRARTVDGSYRWTLSRAVPLRDQQGNIVKWYGTNTDIEDLKRADERHQGDQRQIRRIIDAIPQFITVLGAEGTVLYGNEALLNYTGLTEELFAVRESLLNIVHPDDLQRVQSAVRGGLARGLSFESEHRARRNDGQYRWFIHRYKPLQDENGNILRWYVTGIDIDDHKRTEERMQNENLALREEIDRSSMFEEVVGSSEALRRVLAQVTRVAPTDSTVLILGETGTGKELIARAIHNRSARSRRAFIRVNCAAIPAALIASELFGHEKGAFTGALQRRLGRFESADGGTIFLDEIGDLPAETQITLLRVLQEREFERVGSSQSISVDVRVLAATNRDLKSAVAEGAFRQDLFYRLNVFPIEIPSLRERVEDIPLLVEYLIERYAKKSGKTIRNVGKQTLDLFQAYDWPGNIRELQNIVERAVILCDSETFSVDETWLKRRSAEVTGPTLPLVPTLIDREKEMIEKALAECDGRISGPSGAAAKLRIPRQTLESKISKLGINRFRFKNA